MEGEVIWDDGNIVIAVEHEEGLLYLHCTVEERSITSFRKTKQLFNQLCELADGMGLEVRAITPNPRFCRLLCDATTVEVFTHEGIMYEELIWECQKRNVS